jgi:hypothetical protein
MTVPKFGGYIVVMQNFFFLEIQKYCRVMKHYGSHLFSKGKIFIYTAFTTLL